LSSTNRGLDLRERRRIDIRGHVVPPDDGFRPVYPAGGTCYPAGSPVAGSRKQRPSGGSRKSDPGDGAGTVVEGYFACFSSLGRRWSNRRFAARCTSRRTG
jgi:hypothetical protein